MTMDRRAAILLRADFLSDPEFGNARGQLRDVNHWKFALVILASGFAGGTACADGSGDPAVASSDDGKYADKDGNPTYKVSPDGTVDWYTYSGFRRYHSDCHVCHGPNGEGSSYAPALAESLKTLSYVDFAKVVTNGRKNVDAANDKVMPSFADNVECDVLPRRHLRLFARPRQRRHSGRPSSQARRQAGGGQAGRDQSARGSNDCVGKS